jgi:lipopolysaccharide biosynthesis protein
MLKPNVFLHPEFERYLDNVKKQPDGLTVAVRYEVPFTKYFEELGFTSAAYIPYDKLADLELNDKNCYPLTMLSKHHAPFLKMRTFTERLNVQEPRRLVLEWLKKNRPLAYYDLISHLEKIKSPYLK